MSRETVRLTFDGTHLFVCVGRAVKEGKTGEGHWGRFRSRTRYGRVGAEVTQVKKSYELELLDTGEYTSEEYEDCLKKLGQIGKKLAGEADR